MQKKRQSTALVAAAIAVALALAGGAAAALLGRSSAATTTIKVTEREYHIALSTTTPAAGTITFSIRNAGHITHQFDVSGGGLTAIAKAGAIRPGTTKSLTVKLAGGTVKVWCPLPGHAALGMRATLRVKGASSPTPTPSPTTTNSYTWG
ncbi:MAG TPA: hypothetical protein VFM96_04195 [Gaiellaceae bacterium]|nr:hypothetical protein [Gaiellaceae bacterium]